MAMADSVRPYLSTAGAPPRILLSGATGYVGGRLLHALLDSGAEETPAVGSTLDFWRVEAYEPDRLLRLRAEMRMPGRAWLQFEVDGDESGSRIRQTAIFDPVGLAGLVYWYALLPLHARIFEGMLDGIADRAAAPDRRAPLLVEAAVR
jgi:hypothetical protein